MRSSSWMASATHAARLIAVGLLSTLVVGCGTTKVERDKYYPGDWPAIASSGEDCRGLEGVYENKGELVDEKGRRTEIWVTDLFGKHFAKKEITDAREAMRQFERATLILKPGRTRRSSKEALILVFELSRSPAGQPSIGINSMATLKPPSMSDEEGGWCTSGNLHGYSTEMLGGNASDCVLALGSDESLIVKCHTVFAGIFVAIPFYFSRDYWAHFRKSP